MSPQPPSVPPTCRTHTGGDVLSREGVGGVADEQAGLAHGSERQEVQEDSSQGPCLRPREV